jgi:uncharacterized OsmC-like protein
MYGASNPHEAGTAALALASCIRGYTIAAQKEQDEQE